MRFSSGVFFNHHSPSNESKLDPTPSDKDVAPTHRLGFDEVEERVSLNMASDKLASFFFFKSRGATTKILIFLGDCLSLLPQRQLLLESRCDERQRRFFFSNEMK